jgi:hypothetical protein
MVKRQHAALSRFASQRTRGNCVAKQVVEYSSCCTPAVEAEEDQSVALHARWPRLCRSRSLLQLRLAARHAGRVISAAVPPLPGPVLMAGRLLAATPESIPPRAAWTCFRGRLALWGEQGVKRRLALYRLRAQRPPGGAGDGQPAGVPDGDARAVQRSGRGDHEPQGDRVHVAGSSRFGHGRGDLRARAPPGMSGRFQTRLERAG